MKGKKIVLYLSIAIVLTVFALFISGHRLSAMDVVKELNLKTDFKPADIIYNQPSNNPETKNVVIILSKHDNWVQCRSVKKTFGFLWKDNDSDVEPIDVSQQDPRLSNDEIIQNYILRCSGMESFVIKNTSGNLSNGSDFIHLKDWVYYAVCEVADGTALKYSGNGLYRIKSDGSGKQKINDACVQSLYTDGTGIYYEGNRLDVDTLESTTVFQNIDPNHPVIPINDYLIFVDLSGKRAVKINLDGSSKTDLTNEPASGLGFYNGWLYYSTSSSFRRVRLDGSEDMIVSISRVESYVFIDNAIYFPSKLHGNQLYRMDLDGKNSAKVSEQSVVALNYYKNRIYFIDGENYLIHSMKVDGTDDVVLSTQSAENIIIEDGWLYFNEQGIVSQKFRISLTDGKEEALFTISTAEVDQLFTTHTTSGNHSNGSNFIVLGDYIYYSYCLYVDGISSEGFKENGLYRMRTDGSSKRMIASGCQNPIFTDGVNIYSGTQKINFNTLKLEDSGLSVSQSAVFYNESMIDFDFQSSSIFRYDLLSKKKTFVATESTSEFQFESGWIYYLTQTPEVSMRKVKYDGTMDRLVAIGNFNHFIIVGNAIYYPSSTDGNKIYKMDFDGKNSRKVSDATAISLNSDGKRLYYVDGETQNIHSMLLNGTDRKVHSTRLAKDITIYKGWLYFNDQTLFSGKYRVSISTGKEEVIYAIKSVASEATAPEIVEGTFISNRYVRSGEWIYYGTENGVYRVHPDGSDKKKISSHGCASLVIVGNSIYYVNMDYFWTIFRMNLDGTQPILVKDIPSSGIIVKDGWLYSTGYENGGLYRLKLDGSSYQYLTNKISDVDLVTDDSIIGRRCGELCIGLYRINLDGSGLYNFETGEDDIHVYLVYEGWIYFSLNSATDSKTGLFKVRYDDVNHDIINAENDPLSLGGSGVHEGWMYSVEDEGKSVVRSKLDGTQQQTIINVMDSNQGYINHIIFLGDKLMTVQYIDGGEKLFISNLDGSNRKLFVK